MDGQPRELTAGFVQSLIPQRSKDAHKGTFGHVLVIAGSRGMTGAAVLCSAAALRSGAGLVTLGVPKSQQPIVASRLRPEVMTLPLRETRDGRVKARAAGEIMDFIEKRRVTTLLIGPGLGCTPETERLVRTLLSRVQLPVVLDADAISVLAPGKGRTVHLDILASTHAGVVLTPHPGEMARLTGMSTDEVQKSRIDTAVHFAAANRVICVLKGAGTIVTDGREVFVNTTGNPGMATGGSGDVLAGMIAALVAQVREPQLLNASSAGVFLHGRAGDIAAGVTTEIGLLAGDIIKAIPRSLKNMLESEANHG